MRIFKIFHLTVGSKPRQIWDF